jgi:8-oxo-dGTP diphosphatase
MSKKVVVSDIVLVRDGRILLVQQLNASAFGKWGLPGGRAEAGETSEQTVLREIKEELDIILDVSSIVEAIPHGGTAADEGHLQVMTFLAEAPDTPIRIKEDELTGYGWFTLEQLRIMQPILRSSWILELAERALQQPAQNR